MERGRFIKRYDDGLIIMIKEIHAMSDTSFSYLSDFLSISFNGQSIKPRFVFYLKTSFGKSRMKNGSILIYFISNGFYSIGAMINRIHTGHNSEQSLSGTYIRSCLFSSDMLLPSLECHSKCRILMDVNGYTNYSSGYQTSIVLFGCKVSRMRSTESHRYTKLLSVSDDSICSSTTR